MKLSWNKDDIHIHTSRLLDTLMNTAMGDNLITDDEEAILDATRNKLWQGKAEFEAMLDLDLPEQELKEKIIAIFDNTIKEVTNTARADGIISSDELNLIQSMTKYIRSEEFKKLIV